MRENKEALPWRKGRGESVVFKGWYFYNWWKYNWKWLAIMFQFLRTRLGYISGGWVEIRLMFLSVDVLLGGFSGDVKLLEKLALRLILYYRRILESWARHGSASINESGLDCIQGPFPTSRPLTCSIFSSPGISCNHPLLVLILYLLSE